jgi:hypothetical protein
MGEGQRELSFRRLCLRVLSGVALELGGLITIIGRKFDGGTIRAKDFEVAIEPEGVVSPS